MKDGMTTEEARAYFADRLTYSDINEADIQALYMILNRNVKRAAKAREMSTDTMHMSRKLTIKKRRNGCIDAAFLYINSHYFTQRECISFNADGFIGFCGWADDQNTKPIVDSFAEWCDLTKRGAKAPITYVGEQSPEGDWDEHPTCSLCGSYNIGRFCAHCGVELYESEEL